MQSLHITATDLARVVWPKFYGAQLDIYKMRDKLAEFFQTNESLRKQADYNTGSINVVDMLNLACLTNYVKPKKVIEIGTFIGNSTVAMAHGMRLAGIAGEIHTCDNSNSITLVNPYTNIKINQYKKQGSTAMLKALSENPRHQKEKFDLLYVDGRIQEGDLEFLQVLLDPNVIIALDDFESMEKGVDNVRNLLQCGLFPNHILIHPTAQSDIAKLPVFQTSQTRSATALLLPVTMFGFSRV